MSRSIVLALALILALGLAVFRVLSTPRPLTAADIPQHTPNLANGEVLYHAGGWFDYEWPHPSTGKLGQKKGWVVLHKDLVFLAGFYIR